MTAMSFVENKKRVLPRTMRTIGILTGISHISGADYYSKINESVQHSLPAVYAGFSSKIVLFSVNLEEYVEYLTKNRFDLVSNLLTNGARKLELCGADFLVIASNTGHCVVKDIQRLLPYFPILHITDCVAYELKKQNITCVGLLGTRYTMEKDYVRGRLAQHNIQSVVPSTTDDYQYLQNIIERELSFAIFKESTRKRLMNIIEFDLIGKQKAQNACILGCTEIELLIKPEHMPNVQLFNSAQIHIKHAVKVQLCEANCWDYEPNINIKCRL